MSGGEQPRPSGAETLEERCRRLQRQLSLAQQDRRLIAHELHDGLVQEMTAAQMFVEAAVAQLDDRDSPARQTLDEAAKWLRKSIEAARRLMNGLQPPELESQSLVAALRTLAGSLPAEMTVELQADDELEDLDATVALSLFRLVQESLNNAGRHSQSPEARVTVCRQEDDVLVEVRDWGVGFDVEEARQRRFGLQGMVQRAAAFGGCVSIDSEPGGGTLVRIRMPMVCG